MDINELIHSSVYDAAKRRERYLRSRQLKGRSSGSGDGPKGSSQIVGSSGSSNGMRPSRQAQLKAQREELEKKLDQLRDILRSKVDAAKKRSGVDTSDSKSKESASKTEKGKSAKSDAKPLTAKQKADKRKASAEQYEKEKSMGLSKEVQQLQEQIKDIRAQIAKAVEEAQKPKKSYSSKLQTVSKDR